MNTIKIKNDSGAVVIWAGKEFTVDEEYTIPTDLNRSKWINNSTLITAIANEDALVGDGTKYFTDVNDAINWLKGDDDPKDTDGVRLSRTKITQSGWHFQAHGTEFVTSKLDSGFCEDKAGNDLGFLTVKFYDDTDTELVAGTQAELDNNCVKTIMTWEPDYDIDVIGGWLEQPTPPTNDTRIWVTAVPDIPANLGGSVPFADGGINLRYISGNINIDGKTAKTMSYNATYHTNKFEILVKHDTGDQCPIHMIFKIFRPNV